MLYVAKVKLSRPTSSLMRRKKVVERCVGIAGKSTNNSYGLNISVIGTTRFGTLLGCLCLGSRRRPRWLPHNSTCLSSCQLSLVSTTIVNYAVRLQRTHSSHHQALPIFSLVNVLSFKDYRRIVELRALRERNPVSGELSSTEYANAHEPFGQHDSVEKGALVRHGIAVRDEKACSWWNDDLGWIIENISVRLLSDI